MQTLRGGIFPRLVAIFPLIFPLYLLRGSIFGLPLTLPELLLSFMFLYFILRERVWERLWWTENLVAPRMRPVLLFLAAAILSALISPRISYFVDGTEFYGMSRAFGILKGWIFFPIGYFFMAKFYFREKPSLEGLAFQALFVSGISLSIYALYQVWTGDFLTPDFRASGPFESANYLALYLGPILVYGIFSMFRISTDSSAFLEKIFLIAGLILILLAFYFTKSYAAWISVGGAILVGFLLFLRTRSHRVRVTSVFVIFTLIGLVFFSQISTEKFSQFLDFTNRSSTSVRIQIYEVAWNLIKENPVLGIGLGQFEQVYQVNAPRILRTAPFEWVMIHPHNVFLALWLNLGLAGLLAFLWMIWRGIGWIFEENARGRSIVALMLISILIHGLFDTPVFKNDLAFEFWLLMAMLI